MRNGEGLPGLYSAEAHQLGRSSSETLIAGVLAVLLAVPSGVSPSITVGGTIALILSPVTLPTLWRNKGGRWLLIALLALIPSGWLVAQISLLQDPGRSFNENIFGYEAALPLGLIASLVGAYWCTTKLGLQRFVLLSFAGLLAVAPLAPWFVHGAWKYALALPVSVLVILLLARNRLLLSFVIMPLLIAVSIAGDFRSWIAFLALTTVLTVYTHAQSKKRSAWGIASLGVVTVASAVIVGWLIISAATEGMLGDYLEQRTRQQLDYSDGNLLLGGRPEWSAAIALWRRNPLGIGFGVAPSHVDYWLAIGNMPLGSQAQQLNSIVAFYFKQGQVNFHSTFWTFWGIYGAAGIIFATLSFVYLVQSAVITTQATGDIALRASILLISFSAIWAVLFSDTIVSQLAIALAIALHIRGERQTQGTKERERTPNY